jgi:hypothetical protein
VMEAHPFGLQLDTAEQHRLAKPYLSLELRHVIPDAHRAPVTAIYMSRFSLRQLHSGDLAGHTSLWTLTSNDHWVKDSDVKQCQDCGLKFTVLQRRHHCRKCGKIVCGPCSPTRMPLPELGLMVGVRVCDGCAAQAAADK